MANNPTQMKEIRGIFLRLAGRFLKERSALLVWSQTVRLLRLFGFKKQEVWPICFVKGNLTLGVIDSFFVARCKAIEKEFLRKLNQKIKPFKVRRIFYRFSSPREYDPTSEER